MSATARLAGRRYFASVASRRSRRSFWANLVKSSLTVSLILMPARSSSLCNASGIRILMTPTCLHCKFTFIGLPCCLAEDLASEGAHCARQANHEQERQRHRAQHKRGGQRLGEDHG